LGGDWSSGGTIGHGAVVSVVMVLVLVPDLALLLVLSEGLEDLEHGRHKKLLNEAVLLGGGRL
jgi:hypothetical protein